MQWCPSSCCRALSSCTEVTVNMRSAAAHSPWDLTALLNAADPKSNRAERHLWLVRLMEWLRHAPLKKNELVTNETSATPRPILRMRHLLRVLAQHPEHQARVRGVWRAFWSQIDASALFADFGFAPREALFSEIANRLRERLLPGTPDTSDLAELFQLLFVPEDAIWLQNLDEGTLGDLAQLMALNCDPDKGLATATPTTTWRSSMLDALSLLAAAIQGQGLSGPLRKRMSTELLADEPFRQLPRVVQSLRLALETGEQAVVLQEAAYLRALLDRCRAATSSITQHLEEHGVSVDMVFAMEQLHARTLRVEQLLECLLSPQAQPDLLRLLLSLLQSQAKLRSVRSLLARQYSLLARQVAERNAETGEHYITRDRSEWRDMLRRAAGGGAVIAGTTFIKFAIMALGLSAFWAGAWSGVNYAVSFVVVMLLHWTVATKQPAMTAPAMAASLGDLSNDAALDRFVDKVAQLTRSQFAGIVGNLMVCAPLVLVVQLLSHAVFGATPVDLKDAAYVKHSITLLGPTALFAAFTGVLLFASSLFAGWAENWFVFHRLDSAIAWNPRFVARLGAARAQRWALWWRRNISGLAANVSLGLMLGLVPALLGFVGLPLDVRHVTLSAGQLAAAVGAELPVLGWRAMLDPAVGWCVAGIAVIGVLNLTVSFLLAFHVALRSRGLKLGDRRRIYRAISQRVGRAPLSFLLPPK
jgi:site-specific recombinase